MLQIINTQFVYGQLKDVAGPATPDNTDFFINQYTMVYFKIFKRRYPLFTSNVMIPTTSPVKVPVFKGEK